VITGIIKGIYNVSHKCQGILHENKIEFKKNRNLNITQINQSNTHSGIIRPVLILIASSVLRSEYSVSAIS
jgi:hypothetical protein